MAYKSHYWFKSLILYLLLNFPLPIFIFASEARPVTNTNIVIGNREPSSGSIAIILLSRGLTPSNIILVQYNLAVYCNKI